uniref:CHAT domain-containing protein n=1 Tax=uncultured bacterium esnapd2 TaxID=1366601 RepID=S5TTP2_9BACT|nr:hypothetical protein [uncultured bacterium esnapd2]
MTDIDALRQLVAEVDLTQGELRAEICTELGLALLDAFHADPAESQHLDEAIHYLTEALVGGDPTVEMILADALITRADPADVPAIIRHARRVLDLVEDTSIPLRHLSFAYLMRYEIDQDAEDLRRSRFFFRRLVELVDDPDVHAFAAHVDALLAIAQLSNGDAVPELDQTISRLTDATHTDPVWEAKRRYYVLILRAARFCWAGGDDDDYDAAVAGLTEIAELPDVDEGLASGCRMLLGMLAMMHDVPVEIRRDVDAAVPRRLEDLKPMMTPESMRLATEHLAVVDPEALAGNPLAPMAKVLRATLLGGKEAADPAEIDTAIRELAGVADEDSTVERALALALLNGRKSQFSGDQRAADAMFAELLTAVGALAQDHPLRQLMTEALGALTKGWKVEVGTAEQNKTAAGLLSDAAAALPPDHPAQADAAAKVALSSMVNFMSDRSTLSLKDIAVRLTEASAVGASDAGIDEINLVAQAIVAGFRAVTDRDLDLIDDSMTYLDRVAEEGTAGQDPVRLAGLLRSCLLMFRYMISGSLEDIDAAEHYAAAAGDTADLPLAAHIREMASIAGAMVRSRHDLDEQVLEETRRRTAELHAKMAPGDHLTRTIGTLTDQLAALQQATAVFTRGKARDPAALAELDRAVSRVVEQSPDELMQVHDVLSTALSVAGLGLVRGDVKKFDQAIALMGKVSARTDLVIDEQLSLAHTMGRTLRMRYEFSRDHRDVNNAIDRLEHARRLIADSMGTEDQAAVLYTLAECYHARGDASRGDPARSVQVGLEAVRERAADVLLQTNDVRALETAKAAKDEAVDVAGWCIAAGRRDAAVQALELGRAMVLHATTFDTTLGTLLREGDHDDIAALYERESAAAQAAPWNAAVPGDAVPAAQLRTDVRRRVLKAVAHTGIADRLLAPPDLADVSAALTHAKATALVYLLPRQERAPGQAVIVRDDGSVDVLTLHGLIVGKEITRFLEADENDWAYALNALCEWAWTAAMEDVLAALAGAPAGPRRRIVLVPVGELAHVPWHAARRGVSGPALRYACHDAAISYAASARQFIEARRRPRRQWPDDPVLVGVPGNGLYWAQKEIAEIRRRCYPDGKLLGTSTMGRNRVTPAKVRAVLPGGPNAASLLHLGIHGRVTGRPMDSYLALSPDEDNAAWRLGVREMLTAARQRKADAAGGLVVLAACTTDRTKQLPDEVLTLASTFLTAGAAGAVGARWEVDDLATMFFMIMFHHYLTAGYPDPATALRAAQVWMLNPGRVLPPDVDGLLAEELASIDPAQVANWAAFTYQGC